MPTKRQLVERAERRARRQETIMDDKKYAYGIYRPGSLSGLGEPAHCGVLWARDRDAAIDAAYTIARMHGVLNAIVAVDEIRLEVIK